MCLHHICTADVQVAVDMLADKQLCLSAELRIVNVCIMMAAREICNYSSLHHTFSSMKPNKVDVRLI